jgi:ABC-type transporter Mla subunit MlaD
MKINVKVRFKFIVPVCLLALPLVTACSQNEVDDFNENINDLNQELNDLQPTLDSLVDDLNSALDELEQSLNS